MRLTCNYPGNEHAHVGAQRACPDQSQGTVGFPEREGKKDQGLLYHFVDSK